MNATVAPTLSTQEQAIASGADSMDRAVSDRVLRLYEGMRAYGPPRVCLERSVLFTESFKETEHEPLVLRWAKALMRYAEKSTVVILDDELIVGRPNNELGRWGLVYPELDGGVMPAG